MSDSFKPRQHFDAENTDEETLKRDARAHVARWPHLQVMAELLAKLRASDFAWRSASFTREQWRPSARMQCHLDPPDPRSPYAPPQRGVASAG